MSRYHETNSGKRFKVRRFANGYHCTIMLHIPSELSEKTYNFCFQTDYSFDHSQMLLYYIQKFTPRTAGLLKSEPRLFEILLQLLCLSKPLFPGRMTPQEAVLNQVKKLSSTT